MKKITNEVAKGRLAENPEIHNPSNTEPLSARVSWIPRGAAAKATRSLLASPALLDQELYLAEQIRAGNRYPGQKNFHGYYYFSQTGRHVWHESLLESTTMRWLDLREDIVSITSQPCKIEFSDGTTHYPDLLALHADQRQVLYDVKPTKYLPEALTQFEKTRTLCAAIGWGYEVHSELDEQVRINLEYISYFRHPIFHPGPDAAARLIERMSAVTDVREAAELLGLASMAESRSGVYHLIAAQVLRIELNAPLSDNTTVQRNTHGHA